MAELLLLGTGAAINDGSRETTMLALRGQQSTVVIDCGGNAVLALQRMGVPLTSVERVILTHAHPDHTSGFPLLVEMLWLGGLRGVLHVHGPAQTLDVVRAAWSQWNTSRWEGLPVIDWQPVPLEVGVAVATGADFELTAAPGIHGEMAVIGVRARDLRGGGTVAYSADGQPSPGVNALARGVDWLVHEATGENFGHSTPEQAGALAREAGAKGLILVHLAPQSIEPSIARRAAQAAFGGPVFVGMDLARYSF